MLRLQVAREHNSTVPTWALAEDNEPMLLFSDHVTAIQMALRLERLFLFTQFGYISIKFAALMRYMVSTVPTVHFKKFVLESEQVRHKA